VVIIQPKPQPQATARLILHHSGAKEPINPRGEAVGPMQPKIQDQSLRTPGSRVRAWSFSPVRSLVLSLGLQGWVKMGNMGRA
jgi:hypothetical protein